MRYLTNLDLNKNQILNMAIQNLGIAPSSPALGQMYFNTGDANLYCWTGSWVVLTSSTLTGAAIVALINASASLIDDDNLSTNVNSAISLKHSQNTDTGTSSATFQVGTSGVKLKNNAGNLDIRNAADSALANITGGTATFDNLTINTGATLPAAATIGGASGTNIADAVAKRHTQNTDTGTSSTTFMVGTTGPLVKNNAGAINFRNTGDTAFANIQAQGATVDSVTVATTASLPAGAGTTIGATTGTQIAAAVTNSHAQNTDTGTSSTTFQVGTSGPKIKNNTNVIEARNAGDTLYADFKANTITGDALSIVTTATLPTATTIGSGGPKIRNAAGVVEIRNNADAAYAALKASGLTADTLSIATTAALPAGGSTTIGATTGTQIASAVSASHTQGTDTGTTNGSFLVGTSGVLLKNNGGTELQIRNSGDTAYLDIHVNNLIVDGTTTTINSNTVNIGDNQITLNSDITTNATNSNGGIAVKRLKVDNTTRADAELNYNISTDKWETVTGAVATTLVTRALANKFSAAIGNASLTSIVVTHGLNTRDVTVAVRETATPWNMVYPDIQMTTVDTITLIFAVAPASNEFTVTVIG